MLLLADGVDGSVFRCKPRHHGDLGSLGPDFLIIIVRLSSETLASSPESSAIDLPGSIWIKIKHGLVNKISWKLLFSSKTDTVTACTLYLCIVHVKESKCCV